MVFIFYSEVNKVDDCLQPDLFLVHPNVTSDGSDQPDFVPYTSINNVNSINTHVPKFQI